jgi:putative endonuclease
VNKFFVYILASNRNGTLYIGVTNHLTKRVWEHKNEVVEGFTSKYLVKKLVIMKNIRKLNLQLGEKKD